LSPTTTPDAATEPLSSLLAQAHDGRLQVPEYQRGWIWDDDRIRGLVASVSLGYPIGALMLLEAGSPDLRFDTRPITGSPSPSPSPSPSTAPERLLIDGQQRITALYQALASGRAVHTQDDQGNAIERWYYVDIESALNPTVDRDEAIVSVPDTRRARTPEGMDLGLHTSEMEWEHRLFPLHLVCGGEDARRDWQHGFVAHGSAGSTGSTGSTGSRRELMDRFAAGILESFDRYLVPTILLGRETARWTVRVHGGAHGPMLSDRFRVAPSDAPLSAGEAHRVTK
jgi:hypothetical protein